MSHHRNEWFIQNNYKLPAHDNTLNLFRGYVVINEKFSQKQQIIEQLQKLRENVNKANVQIENCIDRRNELNEQVKKTREEIASLKAERDSINEKVKLLKEQRDVLRTQSQPLIDEINAFKEKIAELKKTLPRVSQRELQEEHDAIEWKISTTSLDLKEEKLLIEDVKQVEIQLSGYKKIDSRNNKIRELLTQRKVFQDQADVLHKEVTDLAAKSQVLHSTMIEKVNALKVSRTQADIQHQTYIQTKNEVLPNLYVKIAELTGQLNGIKASIAQDNKAEATLRNQDKTAYEQTYRERQQAQREKEQALKEKIGAEAKEKLQKGEKINWQEFQLSMGDDDEDDAETQA